MIYTLIKDVLQRNCGEVSAKHFSGGNSTQLFIVHTRSTYIELKQKGSKYKIFTSRRADALGVIEDEQQILKMNER